MVRTLGGDDTDRMEALSDGVFAIVLTLLVLQFEVPNVSTSELPAAVADQETLLVSYLLSFVVVGLYWIIHHNLFRYIVAHDRLLLWLNLLFLLSISFLPYPTELMGVYGTRFTWSLYAINFVLVGVLMTAVWAYAARAGFTDDEIDDRAARLITIRGLISPAIFVLSIAVAAVNLTVAYFVPILIGPAQMVWVRYYQRLADDASEERRDEDQ
ncbi:TMEM175 family protein [Natronorubrum halophilum]|uniref:TMEM175 family protein n=1 Tax=Natronorubrum halophilum TaxID=1702106 RepID=UPI000EF7210A|nr:TMEM175 family protein [Natronorubrum halophilum]